MWSHTHTQTHTLRMKCANGSTCHCHKYRMTIKKINHSVVDTLWVIDGDIFDTFTIWKIGLVANTNHSYYYYVLCIIIFINKCLSGLTYVKPFRWRSLFSASSSSSIFFTMQLCFLYHSEMAECRRIHERLWWPIMVKNIREDFQIHNVKVLSPRLRKFFMPEAWPVLNREKKKCFEISSRDERKFISISATQPRPRPFPMMYRENDGWKTNQKNMERISVYWHHRHRHSHARPPQVCEIFIFGEQSLDWEKWMCSRWIAYSFHHFIQRFEWPKYRCLG